MYLVLATRSFQLLRCASVAGFLSRMQFSWQIWAPGSSSARLGLCPFRNLNCWLPCHQISGFTRVRKYCPSNVFLLGLRHGGLSGERLCLQMAALIFCTSVISHFLSERDKKATGSSLRS